MQSVFFYNKKLQKLWTLQSLPCKVQKTWVYEGECKTLPVKLQTNKRLLNYFSITRKSIQGSTQSGGPSDGPLKSFSQLFMKKSYFTLQYSIIFLKSVQVSAVKNANSKGQVIFFSHAFLVLPFYSFPHEEVDQSNMDSSLPCVQSVGKCSRFHRRAWEAD